MTRLRTMDYKYIEQLLERYWNSQTTLEEEEILRAFFMQDDIPAGMLRYKSLFMYEAEEREWDVLDDDFDERVMASIDDGQQQTLIRRLRPLFRAVACVCVIVTIGGLINHSLKYGESLQDAQMAHSVDSVSIETPSVANVNIVDSMMTDINQ